MLYYWDSFYLKLMADNSKLWLKSQTNFDAVIRNFRAPAQCNHKKNSVNFPDEMFFLALPVFLVISE